MLPHIYLSFLLSVLTIPFAMSLKPRDAIHPAEIERYDSFMSGIADSQYLHMYTEDNEIKLDVYEHPSNELVQQGSFSPSENATEYFLQESNRDELAFSTEDLDTVHHSTVERRDSFAGCSATNSELDRMTKALESRRSRCYQFCGSIAHCHGNNGCPHCYYVGGACWWQKRCR